LFSGIYTDDIGVSTFTTLSLLKDTKEYLNNNIELAPSKCAEIIKVFTDSTEGWEESAFDLVNTVLPRLDLETYFTLPIAMYILRQAVGSLTKGV
jgi:hypothetical protein